MKIRVLTLTEPWASLVAIGAKQVETRSRNLTYTGPLLIHAAKNMPDWAIDELDDPEFRAPLVAAGILPALGWHGMMTLREQYKATRARFPLGQIIAQVDKGDSFQFSRTKSMIGPRITMQEGMYGNYADGRWGYPLRNVKRLATPIPARGFQGIWYYDLPEGLEYVSSSQPA